MSFKVCVIVPYFGNLPKIFDFWLESACSNKLIDFHIITDQIFSTQNFDNIIVHQCSFKELKGRLLEKLGAKYVKSPYKLCDFKPTYGHVFSDIITNYDYWGYSDIDMIFGDLSKLVLDNDIFGKFDKIFELGHLSFYKNTPKVNNLYSLSESNNSFWPYIRDSEIVWVYDEYYNEELGGINGHVASQKLKLYPNRTCFSDVSPQFVGFFDSNNMSKVNCFFWKKNDLLYKTSSTNNDIVDSEIIYAHFQKREINAYKCSDETCLFLPRHWPACHSYKEAVDCLLLKEKEDIELNISYNKWIKNRRRSKYSKLLKEMICGRKTPIIYMKKRIFGKISKRNNYEQLC